ncbi:hypothetical protein D3C85_986350 [compost metagenome]
MLDFGNGRHVRRAAQAGFVGEQPTLDAHQDGRTDTAGEGRLQAEGALDDKHEGGRHRFEVHADHYQGHEDVGQRHHRHQDVGALGDTLDAAEYDQADHHRDGDATQLGGDAEGVVQRIGHGVGLQRVEAETEGHQQQDREDDRQPALTEAMENVEGRAAAVSAIGLTALVQLRQRTLEEAGGHAQQGHQPHPEHRPRATQGNGHRHAGDVAGSDATGNRQHQGLEGAELALLALKGLGEDAEHAAEVAHLDEARGDREVEAETDQGDDKDLAPEQVVEEIEHGVTSLCLVVSRVCSKRLAGRQAHRSPLAGTCTGRRRYRDFGGDVLSRDATDQVPALKRCRWAMRSHMAVGLEYMGKCPQLRICARCTPWLWM